MKTLIVALIVILGVSSCGDGQINDFPAPTKGKIVMIESYPNGVILYVDFTDEKGLITRISFIGSDTCKVGQIVTLK